MGKKKPAQTQQRTEGARTKEATEKGVYAEQD